MYNCLSCYEGSFLWKTQCISECPVGTYPDYLSMSCVDCLLSCESCPSARKCTSCASGFFLLDSISECTTAEACPEGTYADLDSRRCAKCHSTCLTCIGPKSTDCTSCDIAKGLLELTTPIGSCNLLTCPEGEYLSLISTATCYRCAKECRTCDEDSTCLECKEEYITVPIVDSSKVQCKSCPVGYKLNFNKQCTGIFRVRWLEICGDGLNLGTFECDDGNLNNGDGCDQFCNVEDGFLCNRQSEGADICIDIRPPQARLQVSKGNALEIIFTEKVVFAIPSKFILDDRQ